MNIGEALKILNLNRNYSEEDLKREYRRLVMKYHPDKHSDKDKRFYEEKTKLLNEAKDILSKNLKDRNINKQENNVYDWSNMTKEKYDDIYEREMEELDRLKKQYKEEIRIELDYIYDVDSRDKLFMKWKDRFLEVIYDFFLCIDNQPNSISLKLNYAVFKEEEAYKVLSSNGEVGTLNKCPAIDEVFILAGRAWKVISIDEERKTIHVNQTKSSKIPLWNGEGGDVDSKVIQRIKRVLQEDVIYPYLQKNAIEVLEKARELARTSGILDSDIIQYADRSYYVCPWIGTKEIRTIVSLFAYGLKEHLDIRSISNSIYYFSFTSGLETADLTKKLQELVIDQDNPNMVLNENQAPRIDKYDYMVPDELLREAYLYNQVNVVSANEILNKLVS